MVSLWQPEAWAKSVRRYLQSIPFPITALGSMIQRTESKTSYQLTCSYPFSVRHLCSARYISLLNDGVRSRALRTMLPSGSQPEGPGSAPDPVRTAVAQAAHTVRYRRDLRRSPEVLEEMSKKELILVNTAVQACPSHIAATVEPATLISKIRAYLSAHERSDEAQLTLVNRLENMRNQLLLEPEAPDQYDSFTQSHAAALCRSRHSVSPSALLRAFSDDIRMATDYLETAIKAFIPKNHPQKELTSQYISKLHNVHTCMLLHHSITDWSPPADHPAPTAPAEIIQAATESGGAAPRSYRDAARKALPTKSPAQQQRNAQARELRKKTQEIKAQIRCDERSFQLCPVKLQGDRPSFRQLGIGLERKLGIQNLKAHVEDLRTDHGGRYYVQIRADRRESFEKALDRCLECAGDSWDLELPDIGTFTMNNPYLSPTKDKVPVVISNVDLDIDPEDAITAIADQNAPRWQIPAPELADEHFAAPHRLNRRKRDLAGQPLPEWIPSRNLKVFVSKTLYEQLKDPKTAYATLDYMVLPIRSFARLPSAPRGVS